MQENYLLIVHNNFSFDKLDTTWAKWVSKVHSSDYYCKLLSCMLISLDYKQTEQRFNLHAVEK